MKICEPYKAYRQHSHTVCDVTSNAGHYYESKTKIKKAVCLTAWTMKRHRRTVAVGGQRRTAPRRSKFDREVTTDRQTDRPAGRNVTGRTQSMQTYQEFNEIHMSSWNFISTVLFNFHYISFIPAT